MPAFVDTGLNVAHVDDVALGHLLAARVRQDRPALHSRRREHEPGRNPGRGRARSPGGARRCSGFRIRRCCRSRPARRRRPVDRTRAVRHRGRRANVAKEDVLQLGAGDRGTGLRAAAGALGDRRRGRLVQGQRLYAMSTAASRRRVAPRPTSVEAPVRQGARRREFPGRVVADPPRPAGACARASTASPATPTTSPTARRWRPTTRSRRLDRMAAILDGAPGRRPIRRPPPRCAPASPRPASPLSIATTCCTRSARTRSSCATATGTI